MTLTKAMLLEKGKRTMERVDIPGWGTILIREQSQVLASRRASRLFSGKGGEVDKEQFALRQIHMIIDQLMDDEETPMFTDADIPALSELGENKLNPILAAIAEFNERTNPLKKTESEPGSESSTETTASDSPS